MKISIIFAATIAIGFASCTPDPELTKKDNPPNVELVEITSECSKIEKKFLN